MARTGPLSLAQLNLGQLEARRSIADAVTDGGGTETIGERAIPTILFGKYRLDAHEPKGACYVQSK